MSDSHTAELREAAPSGAPLVSISNVDYTLKVGGEQLQILRGVSLEVAAAQVVAIVGPSGSGKTSLLMLLGGLERATAGKVVIAGQDLTGLSEDELAAFRRKTLGIVFQSFHLIPSLSALDNVSLALEIAEPELSLEQARAAFGRRAGRGRSRRARPASPSRAVRRRTAARRSRPRHDRQAAPAARR